MLIKIGSFFIGLFFCFTALAISVEIVVDSASMSPGDPINARVVVQDASGMDGSPVIKRTEGLIVEPRGTSMNMTVINGSASTNREFFYEVFSDKNGTYTLGPVEITHKGQVYRSNSIVLTVSGSMRPRHAPQAGGYYDEEDRQEERVERSDSRTVPTNDYYFSTATVDKNSLFVGAPLIYTYKFFYRLRVEAPQWIAPKFDGFIAEQLGKERGYRENLSGIPWYCLEIKYALFPTKSGPLTISAGTLKAKAILERQVYGGSLFDLLQGGRPEIKNIETKSKPLTITAKPLPTPPAGSHFTGFVGNLTLTTDLSKTDLKVGDSTTLTLSFKGRGNVRGINIPPYQNSSLKFYPDAPIVDFDTKSGSLSGSKIFKIGIVPTRAGKITLPPLALTYYDPDVGFKQLKTSSFELSVSEALGEIDNFKTSNAEELSSAKQNIALLGRDLMTAKRSYTFETGVSTSSLPKLTLFVSLGLLLLYLLMFFIHRKNSLYKSDSKLFKKHKAYRHFMQEFEGIEDGELYKEGSRLLREYIGNKMGLYAVALTPKEILERLAEKKMSSTTLDLVRRLFLRFDEGLYAGGSIDSHELKESVFEIVKQLEKEL